jgi:hypothetical protein
MMHGNCPQRSDGPELFDIACNVSVVLLLIGPASLVNSFVLV